jgi:hypothetical protein
MADIDANLDLVTEGQRARLIRGATEEWLLSQEEDIMQVLVNRHKADELTNDFLRGKIGEVAGLRAFREYLEVGIRRGTVAAEVELGQDG